MATMQLPGLDELERLVARAIEKLAAQKAENDELKARLRSVGKEMDDLSQLLHGVTAGQPMDARKWKRIEKRLESIAEKLT